MSFLSEIDVHVGDRLCYYLRLIEIVFGTRKEERKKEDGSCKFALPTGKAMTY